jgi:anti-sigma regulatory factor (Ser/Thr protein kinase)
LESTTSTGRDRGPGAIETSPHTGIHHSAVFYGDADELLAGVAPPLQAALAEDQPVLVALTTENSRRLRELIGDEAEHVEFLEMEAVGLNPARVIPAWREFVDANVSAEKPGLGICEPIWADRTTDELTECQHHEALVNVAFRSDPEWSLLCPYDTSSLPDRVLEEAMRSHPILARGGTEARSDEFEPTGRRPFDGPLTEAPADAETVAFGADDIATIREKVAGRAAAAGLSAMRAEDLTLAVNELTANSVRHGGGRGELSIWEQDVSGQPRRLVCEVRDAGRIEGPLLGRIRPGPDWVGGRGLWMVNQLCDLLQIRALPEGNLARVQMRIDSA